jgi:hypothetical protein
VKLDDKFYKLVDQMEMLTSAPPSLLHATSLTVKVTGLGGERGGGGGACMSVFAGPAQGFSLPCLHDGSQSMHQHHPACCTPPASQSR